MGRALTVLALTLGACSDPLPEIGSVPSFELVNHAGESFGTEQLRGQVWVANFVFTTCPTVCPMLTTQMGNLQRRLEAEEGVTFVSFSVDPEHDTPEVLSRYRESRSAEWVFLTGEPDLVRNTISQGLRMGVGERTDDGDITHAMHFVLVDQAGMIRGYYRTDAESQAALERDIRSLL